MPISATKLRHSIAILLGLLFVAGPLHAFNANAHRVVGHIAAAHACAETLAAIKQLDSERDLAEAGLWADEIRGDKRMDFAKPWHYINVPDALSVADYVTTVRSSRKGNVLLATERFAHALGDADLDPDSRLQAYRFLVHFVADVHQPLHVGRKEDLGGNRLKVRVDERATSLHSFWDGFDLNRAMGEPRDYAAYLSRLYADMGVKLGGDPLSWAQESKNFRPQVYAFEAASTSERRSLSDEYRDKSNSIINLRMYQAGRRLAMLLDEIFCGDDVNR